MYLLVTRIFRAGGGLRARSGDTERGASLIEYALLVALIALVCVSAVTFFGQSTMNDYQPIGSSLAK
jgi:Flp pilus assembly pilin Flp